MTMLNSGSSKPPGLRATPRTCVTTPTSPSRQYRAETAGSAAEAKSKLALLNGAVDAVVVDVGLPDLRGDVMVSELRAIYPYLPVVIASGYDRASIIRRFTGQHGIEFLHKPFTLEELREALARVGVR